MLASVGPVGVGSNVVALPVRAHLERAKEKRGSAVMGPQALRVCVLVNDATRDEPWLAEHGVAFWVEVVGGARP